MTDAQIENWRKILALQIGPYAFIMPKEQIEKIRNRMQGWVDDIEFECEGCHKKLKSCEIQYLKKTPEDTFPGVATHIRDNEEYYEMCPHCQSILSSEI